MDDKDTVFSRKHTLNFSGRLFHIDQPLIMGILNITPDSFYIQSRTRTEEEIAKKASTMIDEGADIIDIGGYSSRPGAKEISSEEELKRIIPALRVTREKFPEVILSVDTFRSDVARVAVQDFGVDMVNDISGGNFDHRMFDIISDLQVPYVLMHMKGTPENMKDLATYHNIIKEITLYFSEKVNRLKKLGVQDIILDPGFGFAKTISQNFHLLRYLKSFEIFGLPVMTGLSRKSLVYKTLRVNPEEALNGTTVLNTLALLNSANILRVHDVKQAKEITELLNMYNK